MKKAISAAVLLALPTIAATLYFMSVRNASATLTVATNALDFGETYENTKFLWTLPIQNTGQAPVHISGFRTSCTCAAYSPNQLTIPPGETGVLKLVLDLSMGKPAHGTPEPARNLLVSIQAIITSPMRTKREWQIHGKIKRILEVNQYQFNLGSINERPIYRSLTVKSSVDLDWLEVFNDSSGWQSTVTPNGDSRTYDIAIASPNRLFAGPLNLTVTLRPIAKDHASVPDTRIPITGVLDIPIKMVPAGLLFGRCKAGSEITETVTLVMPANMAMGRTPRIEVASDDIVAERGIESSAGHLPIRITQRIREKGLQHGWVCFVFSGQGKEEIALKLPISYWGE